MKGIRQPRPMEVRAMAKKQAAEQEIANWEDLADELPDLPAAVEEFRKLADEINALEKRKKVLAPVLEAAVIAGGKPSLACGSLKIQRIVVEGRKSIAPELIVEKACGFGLDAAQITELLEYSTIQAAGYSYPLVTRVKVDVARDDA